MVHADAPRGAEEVQEAEIASPIRIGDLLAIQKGRPAFGFGCKRGIGEAAGARKRGFEKIRPKEPRASHAHHPARKTPDPPRPPILPVSTSSRGQRRIRLRANKSSSNPGSSCQVLGEKSI